MAKTELELIVCGQRHAAGDPNLTIGVCHIGVSVPIRAAYRSDQRPNGWLLRLRLRLVTAGARLGLAVHLLVQLDGTLVKVKIDTVLSGTHLDVVTARLRVGAPVVHPVLVGAELDLLVAGDLKVNPEAEIVLVERHLHVRSGPVVDRTHNTDLVSAPLLGQDEGFLVKGELVETLGVAHDVVVGSIEKCHRGSLGRIVRISRSPVASGFVPGSRTGELDAARSLVLKVNNTCEYVAVLAVVVEELRLVVAPSAVVAHHPDVIIDILVKDQLAVRNECGGQHAGTGQRGLHSYVLVVR